MNEDDVKAGAVQDGVVEWSHVVHKSAIRLPNKLLGWQRGGGVGTTTHNP